MHKSKLLAIASPALAIMGLATAVLLAPAAQAAPTAAQAPLSSKVHPGKHVRACGTPGKGSAACFAIRNIPITSADTVTPNASSPSGLGPAEIQSAYNLGGTSSGGRTVAIVDAYGYDNAESDLATFRSYYGLPECSSSNGCFTKLDQGGGTSYPGQDVGWTEETALDLDAVSSACPDCKITLVEANTASFADLGSAVNTAAAQPGVVAISNSYGGGDASDADYGSYYNHPGIAVTASTGDNGYTGSSFPSSSDYAVAVGGTTLTTSGSARGWDESAWSGSGSGCSAVNAALAAAANANTGCGTRASADLSAVADPSTGLAIYNTADGGDWQTFGGTSLASPLVAAMYALSGNTGDASSKPYDNTGSFNDVTSGSTGSCSPSQLCNAGGGWDGPTGIGTPNGVGGL